MRRQLVSCLTCLILLLTLILVPGSPVQAAGVAVYDTASYCNVPAANPGDPAYSEMAVEQFVLGFGCQYVSGIRLAETFILDEEATIGSVELFAYQTGSSTTPSFTGAYLAIYDGNPADGASILWGDMVTNRFESAVFTGCYRVMHGSTDTQRPIMKIVADVSTESGPGLELAAAPIGLLFPWTVRCSPALGAFPTSWIHPTPPVRRYNMSRIPGRTQSIRVQASRPASPCDCWLW